MRRPLVLIAVLLAGLALNACGKADEPASEGETEAVYLDLDGLQYQVQISRQLNPYDVEDSYYVRGQNEPAPARDDTWFGVFVRVYNPTDTPKRATSEFEIHDTQGNIYKPVPLDNTNVFRYVPDVAGQRADDPDTRLAGLQQPDPRVAAALPREDRLVREPPAGVHHQAAGQRPSTPKSRSTSSGL